MQNYDGIFITFEGGEGAGKSTQVRLLDEHLRGKGYQTVLTREPGGTPTGERLRELLLNDRAVGFTSRAEMFVFGASRAQHLDEKIIPALKEGKIVICDRFADSTVAYQGYGRGIDFELIHQLNALAVGDCYPDLTFFLDVETELGLRRRAKEQDKFQAENLDFHRRIRDGYLKQLQDILSGKYPGRNAVGINTDKTTQQEVLQKVIGNIEPLLTSKPKLSRLG